MYPISEYILQNVVTTLARVNSIGGYANSLTVVREKPEGVGPLVNGLCTVMGGNEIDLVNPPLGFQRKILPIGIVVYAIEPAYSDQNIRQILFGMAADVRKAMMVDIYRGDYAENTTFDEEDKIFAEGAPANVLIVAKVQYRHLYGDPYNR